MSKKKQEEEKDMAVFEDIKKGNYYENNNLLYTIIVVLVLLLGIFIGNYLANRNNNENKIDTDIKVDDVVLTKDLDINDTLVRSLYNRVVVFDGKPCSYESYDWNYAFKNGEDFIAEDATPEEKATVIASNFAGNNAKTISVQELKDKGVSTEYIIDLEDKEFNIEYDTSNPAKYYDRESVEKMYKEVFGKNSILDKSKDISMNRGEDLLRYIKEIDGYVIYEGSGKGGCSSGDKYTREITAAKQVGEKIQIFETVKKSSINMETNEQSEATDLIKYIYTFTKINDEYIYESRVKTQ